MKMEKFGMRENAGYQAFFQVEALTVCIKGPDYEARSNSSLPLYKNDKIYILWYPSSFIYNSILHWAYFHSLNCKWNNYDEDKNYKKQMCEVGDKNAKKQEWGKCGKRGKESL